MTLLWLILFALSPKPDFVRIPAGSFGDVRFERPFWMGRTEVTVRQFEAFIKSTAYQTAAERDGSARNWRSPGFEISPDQPVVYVTVQDAGAYCAWVGARLPTDPEWEYAARAGATTRHYWGDVMDDRYLWYRPNSDDRPQSVARKRPNAWGLYDVEGNVWEWTLRVDSEGEAWGNRRGGSWVDCEGIDGGPGKAVSELIGLSKSFPVPVALGHRYDDIGFRCARPEP